MLIFYGCQNSTYYIDAFDLKGADDVTANTYDICYWAVPGTMEN